MSAAGVLERRDDPLARRVRPGAVGVTPAAPDARRIHRRPHVVAVFVGAEGAWTSAKVPRVPRRIHGALA